jgi:hypothetical protein
MQLASGGRLAIASPGSPPLAQAASLSRRVVVAGTFRRIFWLSCGLIY